MVDWLVGWICLLLVPFVPFVRFVRSFVPLFAATAAVLRDFDFGVSFVFLFVLCIPFIIYKQKLHNLYRVAIRRHLGEIMTTSQSCMLW